MLMNIQRGYHKMKRIHLLIWIQLIIITMVFINCLPNTDIDSGDGGDSSFVVINTIPDNNDSNVPFDTVISVEFNNEIKPVTINDDSFIVTNDTGSIIIEGNLNYKNKVITFTPSETFLFNETYIVTITDNIQDINGDVLDDQYQFKFTTEPDTYSPNILSHTPVNGEGDLPPNTVVEVIFDEEILNSTLTQASFFIKDLYNNSINGTINYENNTAIFIPAQLLDYYNEYTVTLTTDIEDLAGNPLLEEYSISFTIEPDTYPPIIISHTPNDNDIDVSRTTTIEIEFDEDINPSSVTPSTVYIEDSNNNIIQGTLLYSNKIITFTPNQNFEYITTYNVFVTNGIEDTSGNTLQTGTVFSFTTEDYLKVISHTPNMNESEVETSIFIEINFNKSIDISSVNEYTFTLVNADNGSSIEGEFDLIDNDTLIFKPKYVFSYTGIEHTSVYTGVKPNYNYLVTVKSGLTGILSETNCILESDFLISFKTKDLDYGLYWFGDGNVAYKYISGRDNPFYDPSKPTVIYAHGWQQDSVMDRDYGRECFIFGYDGNLIHSDVSQAWRDAGWNTGIFYWNQFADEPPETVEPEKAEAKIYAAQNGYSNMRYKVYYPNSDTVDFSTTHSPNVSVAELFHDIYIDALSTNNSGNIRIAGHSLGNQLVTRFTWLLKNSYDIGTITKNLMPNRIALLDPYWSGGNKGYLGGITVAEQCTTYTDDYVSYYNNSSNNLTNLQLVVEHYHTSKLSGGLPFGIGGDKNEPIREYTVYTRSWYDFADSGIIPLDQEGVKHILTPRMYFYSYSYSPPVMHTAGNDIIGPSASASNYDLNILMNYYYLPEDMGMCEQTSGKDTLDPSDDEFTYYYLY